MNIETPDGQNFRYHGTTMQHVICWACRSRPYLCPLQTGPPRVCPHCAVSLSSIPIQGQVYPGIENPPGWDLIPGARGCTPQSCAFRITLRS
jgi:hypothetical protein